MVADDRLSRAQRRLFFLSLGALALTITFVVAAVIFAVGREAVREGEYRPFEVGPASRLADAIIGEQPIFFPDPLGGNRGFMLTISNGEFTALHIIPPGRTSACPIDWNRDDEHFEDCEGQVWETDELRRFPTSVSDDEIVVVDLRASEPAPG